MTSAAAARLALMAVHAHPDDESTSTGGILAHYALRGVRTIVVTCTDGELGDGPGGVKPGEDSHDCRQVAAIRLGELRRACEQLGVSDLELLGYHDSGMPGWGMQHRANAFCSVPVETAASRVAQLIEHYRPQVVVTYDPHSTRHPDHVHAARVATYAVDAVDAVQVVAKLYYKAHGSSYWRRLDRALAEVGIHRPTPSIETLHTLDSVDQRITTKVDVAHVIDRKRAALHSHAAHHWPENFPPTSSPAHSAQKATSAPVTQREHPYLKMISSQGYENCFPDNPKPAYRGRSGPHVTR